MNKFRSLIVISAIATSPTALAEGGVNSLQGSETVTTTKTIDRVAEDGTTQLLEKEIKKEVLIDIPVKTRVIEGATQETVPCQDLPPIVVPTDEFIENNAHDDSNIASETEFEVLINEKGEIGYALDEVPAELLEENPVNPDEVQKGDAPQARTAFEQEVEQSIDAGLDDAEMQILQDLRVDINKTAPQEIPAHHDLTKSTPQNATIVKP